jgi:Sensors of blue-light using FAD
VQVVYVSSAAGAMSAAERAALAAQARARSASARLTGLLLHHGEHYYAVIEGPRRRVLQRIEEIIAEQGQRGLRILREEAIRARRFANWSDGVIPAEAGAASPDEFLWRFCGLRPE